MATIVGLEKGESRTSVVLEKVQSIDVAELSGVTGAFKKLRTLGRHIKGSTDELDKSLRHAVPIMTTPSPKNFKPCRTLQRSPTDVSLQSADLVESE